MKHALIFWFTGLSGAGKTTVALAAKTLLENKRLSVLLMDGDEVRGRREKMLGFSEKDIKMNNELIAKRCAEERSAHDVILVPIISPYAQSRQRARQLLSPGFYEIYFSAGLECVMARDTKGLYQKARNREIQNLIGFSASNPYEAPQKPDLRVPTDKQAPEESAGLLNRFILESIDASFS